MTLGALWTDSRRQAHEQEVLATLERWEQEQRDLPPDGRSPYVFTEIALEETYPDTFVRIACLNTELGVTNETSYDLWREPGFESPSGDPYEPGRIAADIAVWAYGG